MSLIYVGFVRPSEAVFCWQRNQGGLICSRAQRSR